VVARERAVIVDDAKFGVGADSYFGLGSAIGQPHMIGEVYGGYTILSRIGAGGMGEVYLGEHSRIMRRAAVKVLRTEYSGNPDTLERFFNEARTTSAIRHPNIVEILDCDVHPQSGRAFIVMEFLEGEGLRDYLTRTGALAGQPGVVAAIMRQVLAGLETAHQRGIVHRDLKPDNVFLEASRGQVTAKILDFGIAKLLNQGAPGASHTQTGIIMGSPLYMSPEQCRGERQIDARSDIYSLGCMLFEMLCGTAPFTGEFAGALLAAHMMTPPPAPSSIVKGIAPELEELTMRMLAKDPGARPQTASEILQALQRIPAEPICVEQKPVSPSTAVSTPGASIASPARGSSPATGPAANRYASSPSTLKRHAISINPEPARSGSGRSRAAVLVPVVGVVAAALAGAAFFALRGRSVAAETTLMSAPAANVPAAGATSTESRPPPAEATAARAAPEPSRVDNDAPRTAVVIRSQPPGAEVFVDGETEPRGVTPIELSTHDDHAVVLRLSGRKEKLVAVRRGDTAGIDLALEAAAAQVPHAPAKSKPKPSSGYKALDD
jgi:serine/threonine-protein kinase